MTTPLRRISDAAKKFGGGDFSARVPVEGDDELAQLAETFNTVSYTHLYPKNEKDNLSAAERNAIRKLIEQLEQFLKTKCEKGRLR